MWSVVFQQRANGAIEYDVLWIHALAAVKVERLMSFVSVVRVDFALHHIKLFVHTGQTLCRFNQHKTIHAVCNVNRNIRTGAMEHKKPRHQGASFKNRSLSGRHIQRRRATTRPGHRFVERDE